MDLITNANCSRCNRLLPVLLEVTTEENGAVSEVSLKDKKKTELFVVRNDILLCKSCYKEYQDKLTVLKNEFKSSNRRGPR